MGNIMNRIFTSSTARVVALFAVISCSDSPTGIDPFSADSLSVDANRVVASIEVQLASSSINVGDTTRARVTMKDRRGRPIDRPVQWSSSDTTIATVSDSGLVTGVAPGSINIVARHRTVSGSAALTVTALGTTSVPVASVVVSLASSTLNPGQTTQATASALDAGGNPLSGRAIAWSSDNTLFAAVSSVGIVTALAAGQANVSATIEGKTGSATIAVSASLPPPPVGGIADPTQLPLATGQTPPAGSYGRNLIAGQTYIDPVSGQTVLKVTDASRPAANTRAHHDYSEGGPYISQPWVGTDGQTYYTLMVAVEPNRYLVDVRYSDLTLSNWRKIDLDGDLSFAFSLNPATPRIAYVELNSASNVVQRYNTATNAVENTGNWPWRPAAGAIVWLQTQVNDTWLVAMGNNVTIVAFRPGDGLMRSYSNISGLDEPHIDREQPYAYLAVGNQIYVCNLTSGAAPYLAPGDPAWTYHPNSLENSDHSAPLRGHLVGVANSANLKYYSYSVVANVTRSYTGVYNVAGFPGEEHRAGQWVFNNGDGNTSQWWTIDPSGGDDSRAKIRSGMIGMSNTDGVTPPRILAVHNSTGGQASYQTQPHTTIAPDGKFVMWTSDNMSGRTDVYMVRVPVK